MKKSVLIVEDEGIIMLNLMEVIERAGYRVEEPVTSGEDAIRRLAGLPLPDLIILDIRLRGKLDGIAVARAVRARTDVPILFVTACTDPDTISSVKGIPFSDCLAKPFTENDLLHILSARTGCNDPRPADAGTRGQVS